VETTGEDETSGGRHAANRKAGKRVSANHGQKEALSFYYIEIPSSANVDQLNLFLPQRINDKAKTKEKRLGTLPP
jgi:hypothetical protein